MSTGGRAAARGGHGVQSWRVGGERTGDRAGRSSALARGFFTVTSSSLTRFRSIRKSSGLRPNVEHPGRPIGLRLPRRSRSPTSGWLGDVGRGRLGTEQVEGRGEGVGLGRRGGQHRHAGRSARPARRSSGRGCGRRPGRPTTNCWNAAPEVPSPRFRSRSTPSGVSGSNGFRRATSQRPPNRPGGEPRAKRLDRPPWTRAEVGNQWSRITSTARSIA